MEIAAGVRAIGGAETLRRPEMEVRPASAAELQNLDPSLLSPQALEELAVDEPVTLSKVRALFDGRAAPRLASPAVLTEALHTAVQQGRTMVVLGGHAYYRETLPDLPLPGDAVLRSPPAPVRGADLAPQSLPAAWEAERTTARRLNDALAAARGHPLPWQLLTEGIDEALQLGLFELADGSAWPCSPAAADQTAFEVAAKVELTPEMIPAALGYAAGRAPTLREVKERLETHFTNRAIADDALIEAVEQAVRRNLVALVDYAGPLGRAPSPLTLHLALPETAMMAETTLTATELQRLVERIEDLLTTAPELAFNFRLVLSAEGKQPDSETMKRLNDLLGEVQDGWAFG
jgi:hypothetical protein